MNRLDPSHISAEPTSPEFENDFISITSTPSGANQSTTVRVGTGFGAVALVLRGTKVLMVNEVRYAIGSEAWELPRGGSAENEDPIETAVRCVEGKTGITLATEGVVSLGIVSPDAEILTTQVSIYSFEAPRNAKIYVSAAESKWFDADELVQSCLDGSVEDSFTCIAVLRARLKGLI